MSGAIILGIVVCFIIFLIFSSWYKKNSEKNKVIPWPPFISKCPEYWELSQDLTKCENNTDINKKGSGKVKPYDGINYEDEDYDNYYTWDGIRE